MEGRAAGMEVFVPLRPHLTQCDSVGYDGLLRKYWWKVYGGRKSELPDRVLCILLPVIRHLRASHRDTEDWGCFVT